MKNVYTPADVARIIDKSLGSPEAPERRADFIGAVGTAVAREVLAMRHGTKREVLVFAGDGLCGAYALAAARELHAADCRARVILFNIGGNLLGAETEAERDAFIDAAGIEYLTEIINPNEGFSMPALDSGEIVVDGIFGSEYGKPLRGGYQAVARYINEHNVKVVSIDLPSGMTSDLAVGMINRNIVHANLTLALVGPSLAFFMPENAELLGEWKILDLPYDKEALADTICSSRLVDSAAVRTVLPKRSATASKADLGHALVFAGSHGMLGAAVLSTRAATRSGCGKVTCHGPRCGFFVMQTSVPSAMFTTDGADIDIRHFDNPFDADGIAIGPGIGRSEATATALEIFMKSCFASRTPLVLDADALNIIAEHPLMLDFIPPRSIITPHAGEFDRLFGNHSSYGTRLLTALEMAKRYKIVIVLKAPHTFIVWSDGAVLVNTSGTEALATAGSGDVLTGLTAGLVAQKMLPEVAAVAAVYVHGIAGRIAADANGIAGTTAEDIADAVGPALASILTRKGK